MAFISVLQAGSEAFIRFLDLISYSEGTSISSITQDNGYDIIVSGVDGKHRMTDYVDHPFAPKYNRKPIVVALPGTRFPKGLDSTASGRYQILYHEYVAYKQSLHLPDFSPLSQDLIALEILKERNARGLLTRGKIADAITACSNIWASFPGNHDGQGGRTIQDLLAKY